MMLGDFIVLACAILLVCMGTVGFLFAALGSEPEEVIAAWWRGCWDQLRRFLK